MSVGQTIKHRTRALRGLVTEGIDRTTRNRRLQQQGRTDRVLGDAATQFTAILKERRRALRAGWQGPDTEARTEELRLALRQYREIAERLLRMSEPAAQ